MKTIIEMARQAGFEGCAELTWEDVICTEELVAFAKLVAQHEREACAKVVGEAAKKWWSIHCATNKHMETTRKAHDAFCALQAAIRARGQS